MNLCCCFCFVLNDKVAAVVSRWCPARATRFRLSLLFFICLFSELLRLERCLQVAASSATAANE